MKYIVIILDEDGECAWTSEPFWSEFGEQLAQEVVSDSEVLFRSNDDYLFLVAESVSDVVFESKAAHAGRKKQLAFQIAVEMIIEKQGVYAEPWETSVGRGESVITCHRKPSGP